MAEDANVAATNLNQTEEIIRNLFLKCTDGEGEEELWPKVTEMVGFYTEAAMPVTHVEAAEDAKLTVKRLVCSPDLPITGFAAGEQNPQCPLCNKVFASKSSYQAHQRTHAKDADDPYRCNICSKTFAVPARLTRHYRTHTGEKPFRCEFCNKSFSVKENLSVHRRIHTKERPYKCDVCSRAFEHSGKLHRHMRIHTGERPHKCTVCAKTFIQSGQLVIHMRTHTGEKPYVCAVCQKGFTCSKQLKVHSRTHTGEKPYSCEICGKSFGYNHVLKLHQVAHYGEKVYKCTICNDTFNSKKCMEAHIKSHADGAPNASPPSSLPSDSSCSSTSDKENKDVPDLVTVASIHHEVETGGGAYDADIRYYLYGKERGGRRTPPTFSYLHAGSGVELLAAAATATERAPNAVLNLIAKGPQEVVAAAIRHPAYFSSPMHHYGTPLHAGDNIRRQVEACLAAEEIASEDEPLLTPPSSSPSTSPAPSISPDPERSLPPRKRSKMILKSMEASAEMVSPVRYSSVIQYARAS